MYNRSAAAILTVKLCRCRLKHDRRPQVKRKQAADKDLLERKRANGAAGDAPKELDGADGVREFARRQGMDAGAYDGDSVMVWGILEGQPGKVGRVFLFYL